jgi:peptidoglycan hydrolase-like protein with peptidoglycan-binding domain
MTMDGDLHVTSPLMRGPAILKVQELLAKLGLSPGPQDAAYGPTTAAAVKDFQASHGLAVDGVVGPETLAGLSQRHLIQVDGFGRI